MTDSKIVERLNQLERDNRRLKFIGIASLVFGAALSTAYLVSCSQSTAPRGSQGTLEKVTAREFDLIDQSGRIRTKISMSCIAADRCDPVITLLDGNGKARTSIGAGTLNISGRKGYAELLDNGLQFTSTGNQPVPLVTAELEGDPQTGGALWLFGKDSAYSFINSTPPGIEIKDSNGFMMDLGTADLTTIRTGEQSRTSAASIVMFGNDKKRHVIWRAP